MSAPCKSCGAQVIWVRTANGRFMPLDAEPNPKGNIVYDDALGTATIISHPVANNGVDLYTSHFATCPDAAAHRKPKAKKP